MGGERPPKYDYQQIADMYSDGMTGKQIAAELGCSGGTVTKALRVIQPEGYTGKSGPRPKEECQRGHDMAEHGKPATNGSGRYCSECRRIRERKGDDE